VAVPQRSTPPGPERPPERWAMGDGRCGAPSLWPCVALLSGQGGVWSVRPLDGLRALLLCSSASARAYWDRSPLVTPPHPGQSLDSTVTAVTTVRNIALYRLMSASAALRSRARGIRTRRSQWVLVGSGAVQATGGARTRLVRYNNRCLSHSFV
jgi:hypothetical protein